MKENYCVDCSFNRVNKYENRTSFLCYYNVETFSCHISKELFYRNVKDCFNVRQDRKSCNIYKRKWWKFWISG